MQLISASSPQAKGSARQAQHAPQGRLKRGSQGSFLYALPLARADTCMHPGLHPLASSAAPLSSLPSLSAGLGLGLGLVSGDATEPSRDYDPNQLFERDAPDHEDLTLPSHAGSHRSHHASHKANEDVEEEEDPMEDIGFRIMSSQTYMRHTQQVCTQLLSSTAIHSPGPQR